jgi:hypothetical protein
MKRLSRSWLSVPAFGSVLVLLLLSPVVSAGPPLFVAIAPYSTYGGLTFHGSVVLLASGAGANTIVAPPTFNVANGIAHQSQRSTSSGGGSHKIQLWSGVENVSFGCPATCTGGNHTVDILWNVTWAAALNTSCAMTVTHPTTFAGANISLLGFVTDVSTSPHVAVGHGVHTIYVHILQAAGGVAAGTTKLYLLTFVAGLTPGHSYTVTTFVQARTLATSLSGCASSSSVLIGSVIGTVAHPTKLVYIKVV